MIDSYFDDMRMEYIKSDTKDGHVLIFKNVGKDESLFLLVNEEELKNIYHKVRRLLESLGLKKDELQ